MIDSLFDLIVALFIASLPVLLAIGRVRRRRAASRRSPAPGSGRGTAEAESTPGGESAEERKVPRRRRRWASGLFRRLRHGATAGAEGGGPREAPPSEPSTAEKRVPGARATARRAPEERAGLETLAARPRRGQPKGAEGLMRRVDRYPPLQRAIVLKEILDKPKGLE